MSDNHDLPRRFPGLSEYEAAKLVAEVRASGQATFEHGGKTWTLTPSPIAGSRAIWATTNQKLWRPL